MMTALSHTRIHRAPDIGNGIMAVCYVSDRTPSAASMMSDAGRSGAMRLKGVLSGCAGRNAERCVVGSCHGP